MIKQVGYRDISFNIKLYVIYICCVAGFIIADIMMFVRKNSYDIYNLKLSEIIVLFLITLCAGGISLWNQHNLIYGETYFKHCAGHCGRIVVGKNKDNTDKWDYASTINKDESTGLCPVCKSVIIERLEGDQK
jgi:hypothetical protein